MYFEIIILSTGPVLLYLSPTFILIMQTMMNNIRYRGKLNSNLSLHVTQENSRQVDSPSRHRLNIKLLSSDDVVCELYGKLHH